MRRFRKYSCKSCKGRKRRFLKRLSFDYVTLLECGDWLLRWEAYTMRHRAMETIWWFGMKKLVLCTSCSCLRSSVHQPSYKLWFWIKILIIWAAFGSKGFKGATMLLVVSFISFFLFCHRTGQCIVRILNWKDSFILYPNILVIVDTTAAPALYIVG